LGLDPARAVLLDLPDPRAARMLDVLDGTRSERAALAHAAEQGVTAADAQELLETLQATGLVLPAPNLMPPSLTQDVRARLSGEAAALALHQTSERRALPPAVPAPSSQHTSSQHTAPATALQSKPPQTASPPDARARIGAAPAIRAAGGPIRCTPAQILRRRAAARIVVAGRGRLGAGIAVGLAEAGVGHVHPDQAGAVAVAELSGGPLRAADVGRPCADAVTEAVARAAPETQTHPVRRGAASLIVQLGYDQPVALLAASHTQRRQPHLSVTIREGLAVVGPLVPRTGAPCLNCVDLHRRERDPGWSALSAQVGGATAEPCGVATVLAATAYAISEVLAFVDGGVPETLGAAVEITAPGRFRRRTWPPHPACGCARRAREPSGLLARDGAKRPDSGG
jgi:hypothetical protein